MGKVEIPIRIVLVAPPPDCDFGIQRGRGNDYEAVSVQRYRGQDLAFDFTLTVEDKGHGAPPNFLGPFAQGPVDGRFVYIDVGTYAGQKNTPWSRRMKIPLEGISWSLIKRVVTGSCLTARVPGTGRDGGPSCATTRLLGPWSVSRE